MKSILGLNPLFILLFLLIKSLRITTTQNTNTNNQLRKLNTTQTVYPTEINCDQTFSPLIDISTCQKCKASNYFIFIDSCFQVCPIGSKLSTTFSNYCDPFTIDDNYTNNDYDGYYYNIKDINNVNKDDEDDDSCNSNLCINGECKINSNNNSSLTVCECKAGYVGQNCIFPSFYLENIEKRISKFQMKCL